MADSADFEKSFNELKDIVKKLEEGDLSLEESLTAYEKGIRLTGLCQKILADAETRIKAAGASVQRNSEAED